MPDKYRYRIPIDFCYEMKGQQNPNLVEKLREESIKVFKTLTRSKPNEMLFKYPVTVNGITMTVEVRTGFLGTRHAPARFRSKEVTKWGQVALELNERSKNEYDPVWDHRKKSMVRKADVPFPVGRYCYSILRWIEKYRYIQFSQMELLEYWSQKYKTKAKCPARPKPGSIKRVKKSRKGMMRRLGRYKAASKPSMSSSSVVAVRELF